MDAELKARRLAAMARNIAATDAAAAAAAWRLTKGAVAEISDPRVRAEILAGAFA